MRQADEAYIEQSPDRRSGRTFRSILRTMLWASSAPNKRVLFATYGPEAAAHAFRMACDITAAVNGRKINAQSRSIILPNQSIVEFRSSRDTGYEIGKRYFGIARDDE